MVLPLKVTEWLTFRNFTYIKKIYMHIWFKKHNFSYISSHIALSINITAWDGNDENGNETQLVLNTKTDR